MMNAPKIKMFIIGMLVILLVMAGVVAAMKFFSPPKITYITAPVVRMDLEESVLATGILKAFKTVAVGAQVNGQLKTLHVVLGGTVKKGQLLAEIDPILPENTLKDAEAQVDNLKAQILCQSAFKIDPQSASNFDPPLVKKYSS